LQRTRYSQLQENANVLAYRVVPAGTYQSSSRCVRGQAMECTPMLPVPVRDWGDAIWTSTAQALALFLAAIPKVIAFLIILAVGWLIASVVARAAAALLRGV